MMTDSDYQALLEQNEKTLAKWHCELNIFEWPEGIPDPEPVPSPWHGNTRRSQIMWTITCMIGEENCSREWNTNSRYVGTFVKTTEQFEQYWKGRLIEVKEFDKNYGWLFE